MRTPALLILAMSYLTVAAAESLPLKLVRTIPLPGVKGRFDHFSIDVIDRENRFVLASWPMEKFQANFPMALDEANHRLFVGCRKPPRLVILDTEVGKPVADLAISGDTDDLFHDVKRKRIYVSCGEGFIDVVEQSSAGKYQRVAKIPTAPGARTSFFSADLDRYYLAVPERGTQKAEIRVHQPE